MVKTHFSKFRPDDNIPRWAFLFHAGDAWLDAWRVLKQDRALASWRMFYVEPWTLAFCLELFVKSLAAHDDPEARTRNYGHNVVKLIKAYAKRIDVLAHISEDAELMALVAEYEKTIDTRYGETGVEINDEDQEKVVRAIREIRGELCKRTGLR